jgi:AICAR transformylase/IMP cyclohydrolase PurH
MIDIGGPTMVRAAAKNCDSVAVVTDPSQYAQVLEELQANDGALTKSTRRRLARDAFFSTARYVMPARTPPWGPQAPSSGGSTDVVTQKAWSMPKEQGDMLAEQTLTRVVPVSTLHSYDSAVAAYFSDETGAPKLISRHYEEVKPLKYGVNPHQNPAAMSVIAGHELPFDIINGAPGYTNLMDALNSWQVGAIFETPRNRCVTGASLPGQATDIPSLPFSPAL